MRPVFIWGAPGIGKSSLVKAGLLPSLAAHVQAVYVTADYLETEARIRAALSASFPDFRADMPLAEGFRLVRRLPPEGPAKQILIVLDQFEAWLIANPAPGNTELAKALARCDGRSATSQVLSLAPDQIVVSCPNMIFPTSDGSGSS